VLSSGERLIKGTKVTSFTNSEEEAVQLMSVMPFPLETKLTELGGNFIAADNFKANVQVCD
jgi:putative intracellular protease/amidase